MKPHHGGTERRGNIGRVRGVLPGHGLRPCRITEERIGFSPLRLLEPCNADDQRAALREIFDESAYDRFLVRTHASRSVASYRDFARERDAAMLKKPRCC